MTIRRRGCLLALGALLLPCLLEAADTQEIRRRGSIRIGVSEFAPWTFTNRAGQLEGFEIDNGRTIAQDLGVKPEFKAYPLEKIFGALESGEIDFIAAGLAITPARAQRVEFSLPYFQSGMTLATNRKLAPGVKKAADLNRKGFVVVTVEKTFSADMAGLLFDVATVRAMPDAMAAEKEVLEGRAHALLTNVPEARILARTSPEAVELPLAEPIVSSVAAFAVRPGNQSLLNYLNAWIAMHKADTWLATTYAYWFDGYDWVLNVKK